MSQIHVLFADIGCVKYCHKSLPSINLWQWTHPINHWNSKEKCGEEGGGPNYNIENNIPNNNNNNETLNKNSNMGKGIW